MSSHSLENPIPSSDDSDSVDPQQSAAVESSKLPPLSPQAQADLWRYIDHLEHWRKSIGHEIHDGLTQQITAALLFLEAYEKEKPDTTSLDRCKTILESALAESRRLIQGLNPQQLDEEGIEAAVLEFLKLPSPSTATVNLDFDEELPSLAPWQRSTLFRFFQEAITNGRKHSNATEIHISLHSEKEELIASVSDNGIGFDLESVSLQGFGLRGLEEKATMLQGKLSIATTPGEGTQISLRIPISPK